MKYAIGLDCGISSVGFAAMELDSKDEPRRIITLGSRVFDKAENPKDGSSLALPRREARGARRRLRRRRHRIERIKRLIVESGILSERELDSLFTAPLPDIYMIRAKALDERLENAELARVMINLAQRRGFRSNRKSQALDKETGKLLEMISENQRIMSEKGYRTVGEMLFKDEKYAEYKRNKGESYANTVSRDMIEDEAKKIFAAQRAFKNQFASEETQRKYLDILLSQRPFDLGPGPGNEKSPSPYSGDQIFRMIGSCTLFPEEKRAAKATYSFQMFSLWQNINNISLVDEHGNKTPLSNEERQSLCRLCLKSAGVTYKRIRKELSVSDDYTFSTLSYGENVEETEKKAKFSYLDSYHEIRKALDKYEKGCAERLSADELDAIGTAFTLYKNDDSIVKYLRENGVDEKLYPCLLEMKGFAKFGHISVKACKALIPFLQQGLKYDKACEAAGIDFKAHSGAEKSKLLPAAAPELEDITNPVVRRSVSQTIKVINTLIRQLGESPTYINIELARDLSKSKSERDDIEKAQQKNRAENEKVKERLRDEFGVRNPTGLDIVKFKLWQEQDGVCPYSLKKIPVSMLFVQGYVDIDHIVPYSISFDDSYNNKVLVRSAENRQKGNRLPLKYLSGKRREDFIVWVENNVKKLAKKRNLLKEEITEKDFSGFRERNLNDTRYLNRVLLNYIADRLQFADFSNGRKRHVLSVNGAATDYMRKRWGVSKIRENGDLHHAQDAAVIACVTHSNVQKISRYSKFRETEYTQAFDYGSFMIDTDTGEVLDEFPLPYPEFRKELEYRLSEDPARCFDYDPLPNYTSEQLQQVRPAFVSRMANHKVTGAAHKETIRSGRVEGFKITKTPLSSLKLKNDEIENYYEPQSDRLLYDALKKRLLEYGGNGAQAFPPGFVFRKPRADGSDGPVVKKVKLIEKTSSSVLARGDMGIADNGSMVRIDVFKVEGEGYYFVPIYVADTVKPGLPNLACSRTKDGWKPMDDKDFVFSLYNNDLIRITKKSDIKLVVKLKESTLPKEKYVNNELIYYTGANINTASISVLSNDGAYWTDGIGIKSLIKIEKYTVDPIGNYTRVNREKRTGFKK